MALRPAVTLSLRPGGNPREGGRCAAGATAAEQLSRRSDDLCAGPRRLSVRAGAMAGLPGVAVTHRRRDTAVGAGARAGRRRDPLQPLAQRAAGTRAG